jgi:hypothetical protein
MEIQISVFWVVLLLVIFLVITEHLHNWWFRKAVPDYGEDTIMPAIITFILKWVIFILILRTLLL